MPDITFLSDKNKSLIKVTIYRGSTPPYYVKKMGKLKGTFVRVGSTNRLADEDIIGELERRKRNISFDSEIVLTKALDALDYESFKQLYKDKTGEELNIQVLKKLELVKEIEGALYPTQALVLFSDDDLRNSLMHFAKIECARFKGTQSEEFIDQKTIDVDISRQAEEAYRFVLRHINKGATVEGVYTISRWEYPLKAIREAIRNAVVHRDYALGGKDIKVAIYDDMIEITSPGLLPPSIDYSAMESRQSDAKNKTIAPVFKRLGIIDQWGNGLKMIADELKEYPDIEFIWRETGLSFQVQFIKKDFVRQQESQQELQQESQQELVQASLYTNILLLLKEKEELSSKEISEALGQKEISGQLSRVIRKLLADNLVERMIPESPNHPAQKHRLTERGGTFLKIVEQKKKLEILW